MHEDNCFLTLTYQDSTLPPNGTLELRDWQLFRKRAHKRFGRFRFFHCGEYGETHGRPHYHAAVFGLRFPDQKFAKRHKGNALYTSTVLDELWSKGQCWIGALTFESAAYIARYALKKSRRPGDVRQREAKEDPAKKPEYITMSVRPGIGAGWLERYHSEVYPRDEVVARGQLAVPPRFYDRQMEKIAPEMMEQVKRERVKRVIERVAKRREDWTPERLAAREQVQHRKQARRERDPS